MTDDRPAPAGAGRHPAPWMVSWTLGVLSLGLFFVPLVTPFLQIATLAYVLRRAWRGEIDRLAVIAGAGGAALGIILFLALELVWIV
ncbi:MAG TPA: hypothetical protein VEO94_08820 [Candidatus Dormibacteraeota bacterium]|nr:hypothetical protein [Candidatus Dormibacteraeota bacterium]